MKVNLGNMDWLYPGQTNYVLPLLLGTGLFTETAIRGTFIVFNLQGIKSIVSILLALLPLN